MDQKRKVPRQAPTRRSKQTRPWMTPLQLDAYLLARDTLRRLNRAASASLGQGGHGNR